MSLLGKVIVDSEPAMPCQIEEKNEKFSFFMSPAEVALVSTYFLSLHVSDSLVLTFLNGETGGTERFLLRFISRIGKIYTKFLNCGG